MPNIDDADTEARRKDWTRRPLSLLLWWGLPIALGISSDLMDLPLRPAAAVWTVALAWMGAGCVLNALRCHRVHCYLSGPALVLGAALAALIATGAVDFGPQGLNIVIWGTFAATLLSFAPELLWKRHARD